MKQSQEGLSLHSFRFSCILRSFELKRNGKKEFGWRDRCRYSNTSKVTISWKTWSIKKEIKSPQTHDGIELRTFQSWWTCSTTELSTTRYNCTWMQTDSNSPTKSCACIGPNPVMFWRWINSPIKDQLSYKHCRTVDIYEFYLSAAMLTCAGVIDGVHDCWNQHRISWISWKTRLTWFHENQEQFSDIETAFLQDISFQCHCRGGPWIYKRSIYDCVQFVNVNLFHWFAAKEWTLR